MPVSQDATSASQLAEAVMENAPVAIIVSDGTGMITYANAVALRYFGYSRDEWIAQSVDILLPKQFRHRHIEHRRKYSEHSTPRPMGQGRELAGLRKDGTEFPIEVSLQPLPTATGIAVTTVIVDVTERRKLEDYQRISDRLGAVRQIAAPMANEFNNIFAAILGNTKLTWDDLAGGGCLPETLKQVEQSVWRGSALAKRLAALGSSHLPKRNDVELNEAIKKALPLVRASLPSNITLHTDLDSGSFSLIGDSDQIEHVVLNLCSNAVLSMNAQGGLLTIKTEMSSVDADNTNNLGPGNYLRLSICDTGTGMEPETLKRIFEPFFTTRAEGAGSGLGLYVVKNIVDKLNGRVVVNSSAGKGTTVDVYVPLAKSTTRQKNVPNIAEHPQRSQGERILYVDDDEAMVELLTRSLKRLGYDVTGSSNPVSSLTIFQTDPMRFDAVVSGLSMPHMSGIDLAREIRKVRPDIPLLITTGYIRPDDAAAARNLGLPDLILKPNAVEDLANLIASLLKNKGKKEDHPLPTGKGASGS